MLYIKIIIRIISLLPKCDFHPIRRRKILIIDRDGAQYIQMALGVPVNVLPVRGEAYLFYPALRFIFHRVRRIVVLLLLRIFPKFSMIKDLWIEQLDYITVCINTINPEVIMTFVDNYYKFYELSERFSSKIFISVQNGWRNSFAIRRPPAGPDNPTLYLAMSQFDRDMHLAKGFNPDRILVVGSLRQSLWRRRIDKPKLPSVDICVVTQWRSEIFGELRAYPHFAAAHDAMHSFVGRYAKERGLSVAIAGWDCAPAELQYYTRFYGPEVSVYQRDSAVCVYDVMESANFIVTLNSTAGREAMADRKKVLFCDYPNESSTSDDAPGLALFYVTIPEYEEFVARADFIRGLDAMQWDQYSDMMSYFMKPVASDDACDQIKNIVTGLLTHQGEQAAPVKL